MKSCMERCHIPPKHFSLYNFMVAVEESRNKAAQNGTAKKHYKTTIEFTLWPSLAANYCCCDRWAIQRTRDWLVAHGWLEVIKEATFGRNGMGVYRVVRHDEWTKKHSQKNCQVRHYSKPSEEGA